MPPTAVKPIEIPQGQRSCVICNEKAGHNARTCPKKDEIAKKLLLERQKSVGEGTKMKPQGKRTCGNCNTIRGHNARTCERLQLQEQLLKQQLELQSQKKSETVEAEQANKASATAQTLPRRQSSRLQRMWSKNTDDTGKSIVCRYIKLRCQIC